MRVLNFRSIKDETLECDALTALVGANGSGKSSFLRALELFYSPTPRVDTDDFYAGDISQEITIALALIATSPLRPPRTLRRSPRTAH